MPFPTQQSECLFMHCRHKNHVFASSSNTQTSVQQGQIQTLSKPAKEPKRGLPGRPAGTGHASDLRKDIGQENVERQRRKAQWTDRGFLSKGASPKKAAKHNHLVENSLKDQQSVDSKPKHLSPHNTKPFCSQHVML